MNIRSRTEVAILSGLFIAIFAPVLGSLITAWNTRPDASHGWFVVPIAAWIAWQRRDAIQQTPAKSFLPALGLVLLGLLSAIVAERAALESIGRFGLLVTLNGLLLYLLGPKLYGKFAFPALFLFLMVPVPITITGALTFPLQIFASSLSEFAIGLLGIDVSRTGNVLILPSGKLEVAEACSGLRSLMTFVTVGVLLAWFTPSIWKKILIAVLALPTALFANVLRITLTAAAVQYYGPGGAEGLAHQIIGTGSFLVALAIYAGLARMLGSKWAGQ